MDGLILLPADLRIRVLKKILQEHSLVEMLNNRTFSIHGLKRDTVWMDRVKPLMVDLKDMIIDRLGEVPR